jgi:CheY-like chemotaxis protein
MEQKRIVIVEDELLQATVMKDSLEGLGYAVPAVVITNKDAITAAELIRPDLILMDIGLAGKIDGIETAKEIRERFHIPIMYVTAYADEKTMEAAKKTDPIGYLIKPFDEYNLRKAIEEAFTKMANDISKKEHTS